MKNFDLIWARQHAGWNITQAAEVLGVTRRSFSRWENGNAMPPHQFNAFLAKAGVTISEAAAAAALLREREVSVEEKQAYKPSSQSGKVSTPRLGLHEDRVRSMEAAGGVDAYGVFPSLSRPGYFYAAVFTREGDTVDLIAPDYQLVEGQDAARALAFDYNVLYGVIDAGIEDEFEAFEQSVPHGFACRLCNPEIEARVTAMIAKWIAEKGWEAPGFWNTPEGKQLEAERDAFQKECDTDYRGKWAVWLIMNDVDASAWWVKHDDRRALI